VEAFRPAHAHKVAVDDGWQLWARTVQMPPLD
jgi:hypothetical protein